MPQFLFTSSRPMQQRNSATILAGQASFSLGALAKGAVLGIAVMSALGGCAGSVPPPEVSESLYQGPLITVEQSMGNHVVVANMPSPGWNVKLDRVLEGYRFQGAYITLQEPNPAFSYAQMMVTQRIATNIRQAQAMKVFVRFADFNGVLLDDESYVHAGGSDADGAVVVSPATLQPTK